MATVTGYWRPTSLAHAFELLDRPGAVVMAGGTTLNARPSEGPVEVVDLQALELDTIAQRRQPRGAVVIGATTTLQAIADSDALPGLVREAARRELPSTLRAQATVGGRIALGDPESELLAALLVHEAVVRIASRDGDEELALATVLARLPIAPGRVIVAVAIRTGGKAAAARTGRTTADVPIVAAYAREATADANAATGTATQRRRFLALTGVAARPVLVDGAGETAALAPAGDFRGSAEYRRSLAATLLDRAVEALA